MIEPWKKLSEERVSVGRRKMLRRMYRMPDGRETEFVVNNDGPTVAIVALTRDERVILVKQFRPGPEKVMLDLPGGGIEKGESPHEAVLHELLEETGYKGDVLYAGSLHNNAYSSRVSHSFLALNCVRVQEPKPDPDEFIETVQMPFAEFGTLIRDGGITDVDAAYMALHRFGRL